ncbi:MAG TPA: divalent cation tolerance protein CutA, partial [Candidatus Methylomirabilis sp.]|nr:divalent cation tolerance protein CutA [Candidatus Methylomirabilis sp.]
MRIPQERVELDEAESSARRRLMKSSRQARIVLVTCANPIQAKLIARSVVEKRLAACVNIVR